MYDWHSRPLDAARRLILKTKHDVCEAISAFFFRQRCTKPDSPIMSSCSQALGLLLRLARSKGSIMLDVSLTKDRSRAGFRNVVLFWKKKLGDGQSPKEDDCITKLYGFEESRFCGILKGDELKYFDLIL
jgi:hypothetical protein